MQSNAPDIDLFHLATELRGGPPDEVVRLPGGRNNVVARVRAAGEQWLLKVYFSHPDDRRDRLGAEFGMLEFLRANDFRCVPRPAAARPDLRAALFEYVEGTVLERGAVTPADIGQLTELLAGMWQVKGRRGSEHLPPASDAHLTLASWFESFDTWMERLLASTPLDIREFVETDLAVTLDSLKAFVVTRARKWDLPMERELPMAEQTLTPADHGFHNAIRRKDGRLVFLDFEYAGWDDPAQMVANAFLHPEVPMPVQHRAAFVRDIMGRIGAGTPAWRRLCLVHALMAFKWALIMLNEFVTVGHSRRAFAGEQPGSRRDEQLAKSRAQLGIVRETMAERNWLEVVMRSEHAAGID